MAQQQFFISTDGIDSNRGSKDAPVASLQKAVELYRQSGVKGNTEIIFREGVYNFAKTVKLGSSDSGSDKLPLVIKAYGDEKVILDAGATLKLDWKPYKKGIYRAEVTQSVTRFEQFFVNGQQKVLARYPNYDASISPYGGWAEDAIAPSRLKKLKGLEGAYYHVIHAARWGGFHYQITGVDKKGNPTLEGGWQNNRPENGLHKKFRMIENTLAELDAPNEWYFDGKYIYFYPADQSELDAKYETDGITEIISMLGSEEQAVKNITLKNLTFQHTARTFMQSKEQLLRSDWAIYRGGAVLMDGAENCQVTQCNFYQIGGNAVFVSNYARNIEVSSCHMANIGASGICFVGSADAVRSPNFHYKEYTKYEDLDLEIGPKTNQYPANCKAYDNLIHGIGEVEKQTAAVQIAMAMDIHVSHNSIYNCSRAGINVGDGTWGGHIIEFNDVFNTVLETSDHGSFNSWGRDRFWQPNRKQIDANVAKHPGLELLDAIHTTIIRNNRMRCDHGWDIDLDDGSTNYHVYNNLCLNNGIKLREGYHRVVENNICVNNSLHPHVWQVNSGDVVSRNIFGSYYFPIAMKDKWGTFIDFNVFDIGEKPTNMNEYNRDLKSIIANPLFINPAEGDYRVQNNSPAIALGFMNFDMDNFGVVSPFLKDLAETPDLPEYAAGLQPGAEPSRDNSVHEWLGGKIKNLVGIGEISATGMHDETGVFVIEVPKGSTLEKFGFKVNDVILDFWGQETHNVERLMDHYENRLKNKKTPLGIWRDQQPAKVYVE
ncbi:MAG: PDZ domain-containing protein [Bacteroidales bacterium]|nr:PDZ domain-containing protein [Bacteroidales bacterium]